MTWDAHNGATCREALCTAFCAQFATRAHLRGIGSPLSSYDMQSLQATTVNLVCLVAIAATSVGCSSATPSSSAYASAGASQLPTSSDDGAVNHDSDGSDTAATVAQVGEKTNGEGASDESATTPTAQALRAAVGPLSVGRDSLTFKFAYSNSQQLDSGAFTTVTGSTLLAVVGMGALANVHPPRDNRGNTFRELLPPHNYVNWWGSGQQLYAATQIRGGTGHVVTETMPEANDEVTLSVIEIRGARRISAVSVAEQASYGPVRSATVKTTGPAILVAWWWGDGAIVQTSATTSAGWSRVHSLGRAQAETGVLQTELAAKAVSAAGSYSITWRSDPDQGAVVYLVAVE